MADRRWDGLARSAIQLARNDIADKEDRAAAKIVPTATTGAMQSLVTPQWQFIAHESMGDQLYDWTLDPESPTI